MLHFEYIPYENNVKYLGVTPDGRLQWKDGKSMWKRKGKNYAWIIENGFKFWSQSGPMVYNYWDALSNAI